MLRHRAIPLLLAVATLVPIGALAWLGIRILRQDSDRGGNRNPGLDPALRPLRLTSAENQDLIAFLRSLTGVSTGAPR